MKRARSTRSGACSTSSGRGTIPACRAPLSRRARVASSSRSPIRASSSGLCFTSRIRVPGWTTIPRAGSAGASTDQVTRESMRLHTCRSFVTRQDGPKSSTSDTGETVRPSLTTIRPLECIGSSRLSSTSAPLDRGSASMPHYRCRTRMGGNEQRSAMAAASWRPRQIQAFPARAVAHLTLRRGCRAERRDNSVWPADAVEVEQDGLAVLQQVRLCRSLNGLEPERGADASGDGVGTVRSSL